MAEGGEKTEQATARRRDEARKQGTVARSTDLCNAAGIIAMLMVLPAAVGSLGSGFVNGLRQSTTSIPNGVSGGEILSFSYRALAPVLPGLGMILATAIVVGLVSNFAQVGFMINGSALTPNFNKLNPFSGITRLFSTSSLFEGGKAMVKLGVFGYVAYATLAANWERAASLWMLPPIPAVGVVAEILRTIVLRVAMVWGALAAFDYFYQRMSTEKQLRMTKEEVKQEAKQAESSPEVRAARAQRRRKLLKSRSMDAVKTADVIVTNPTHFAVALKYEPGKSHAPIVVAKGVDFLAARIREEAKKARVPIVPNPPLARALYKQCEIGDTVPRELFQAVAEVLAYVFRTIKRVRQ